MHFKLQLLAVQILGLLLLSSCATQVDLSKWRADSENVTSLSILVEDDGNEGSPALLGDNTLIFESKKNDNSDLWSINLNKKTGLTQLTTYDGPDRLAVAHPDGKRYIFLSDRSETGFYLGTIGKPTVVSIVEAQKPNFGGWVQGDISPNGKIFLYVSGKYIWAYDMESHTRTQFIQGTQPCWAPDGNKIFYRKIGKEINNYVSTSIWSMNPDGTEQTEIIGGDNDYSYSGARVSPNGEKLLYLKKEVKSVTGSVTFGNPDIWICNIDGSEHSQITTHPLADQEAIWVDNQTIIFCSNRPQSGNIKDMTWDIWQLKLY